MEKRVLVTIAMCVGILGVWWLVQTKFFPPPPPPPPPPAAATVPPVATPASPTAAPPASPIADGKPSAPTLAAKDAPPPRPEEQRLTIQRDGLYRAVFTTWGAAPVEFTLLNPQYKRSVDGKDVPINLVVPTLGSLPVAVSFLPAGADAERSDFALAPDAAWTLAQQTDTELVYTKDVGDVHLEKRWTIPRQGYQLDVALTVENRGQKPLAQHLIVTVPGWQDPNVKPGGFLSFGKRVNLTSGECDIAGKVHRLGLSDATTKPLAEAGDLKWVAISEQFFIQAATFAPEADAQPRTCNVYGDGTGKITSRAVFAGRTLAPGGKQVYPIAAFLGPKMLHQLDAVTVGGVDPKLGDAVNYTLEFVARPMFWVLRKIQSVVVNWGLAIIVITILLKLIMFYPTQKSMQSARAMAKLKPDLDRLKVKFGDDKAAFNQAQMALFKEKGVNPLGGCLPMLLQMPIYIAFYSMLSNAVELYRAPFIGAINDMTAPFWPMAVATGALMFLQQKISPTSPDSQQQKMMMYMMPVMFMVFTIMLPSGLTLYILTNTLLSMAQQWYINSRDPMPKLTLSPVGGGGSSSAKKPANQKKSKKS